MNRKKTAISIFTNILFGLTFLLTLFSCSSQTSNSSDSDTVSIASSSSVIRSTIDSAKQKSELAIIYSQAIGDFIQFVNKEYNLTFDTLFFGKHVYGQPDDFPNIELPPIIENTNIKLINPEQGKKTQNEYKSSFYINLIGWVYPDNADFTFITFSNGFDHQFDCFIKYNYNAKKQAYEIKNSRFENFLYKIK